MACVGSLRKWGHTDLMQGALAAQEDVIVYVCMLHPPPEIPALDMLVTSALNLLVFIEDHKINCK